MNKEKWKNVEIPRVASIPQDLYEIMPYERAFKLLGFKENEYGNLKRTYSNTLIQR